MSRGLLISIACFFAGWALGVVLEYFLHIIMHRRSLKFHLRHHHDYFNLPARDVALGDLRPGLNLVFFGGLIIAFVPLMFVVGVWPMLVVWAGAVWHLLIVYEACHALIHYDKIIPGFITSRGLYRWWRGCHLEHHRHSPTGNFSVTFPVLDWIFGTYIHPEPNPNRSPRPAATSAQ